MERLRNYLRQRQRASLDGKFHELIGLVQTSAASEQDQQRLEVRASRLAEGIFTSSNIKDYGFKLQEFGVENPETKRKVLDLFTEVAKRRIKRNSRGRYSDEAIDECLKSITED